MALDKYWRRQYRLTRDQACKLHDVICNDKEYLEKRHEIQERANEELEELYKQMFDKHVNEVKKQRT